MSAPPTRSSAIGAAEIEAARRFFYDFHSRLSDAWAASGLYGPDNNAGAGGLETLAGFLYSPVKMSTGGADVQGALLEHGRVVEANLPIAIDSAGKTDLAGRVTFV